MGGKGLIDYLHMRWQQPVGLIAIAATLTLPMGAHAHDTAASGPVRSTIHVDPDDSPVIGQPATIEVQLKRDGQPFNLTECQCTLTIIKNRTTLTSLPLPPPSTPSVWSAIVPFTFPGKDTYTLVLAGQPKNDPDAFPAFTLKTVFRVIRTNARQPAAPHDPSDWTHNLHFVLPAAAGLFLIIALIIQARRRRSKKSDSSD